MRRKGSNQKRNFSVRMNDDTIEAIETIAKMRRRTKTDLIRIIVENYVKDWQETEEFAKHRFSENVTQLNDKKLIKIQNGIGHDGKNRVYHRNMPRNSIINF